jgi:hypothetical protein
VATSRSRDVPSGTVGGRIAWAKTPCSSAAAQRASAASGAPTTSGTIGIAEGSTPNASRNTRALACSRPTSAPSISSSARSAAPIDGGGSAVE